MQATYSAQPNQSVVGKLSYPQTSGYQNSTIYQRAFPTAVKMQHSDPLAHPKRDADAKITENSSNKLLPEPSNQLQQPAATTTGSVPLKRRPYFHVLRTAEPHKVDIVEIGTPFLRNAPHATRIPADHIGKLIGRLYATLILRGWEIDICICASISSAPRS